MNKEIDLENWGKLDKNYNVDLFILLDQIRDAIVHNIEVELTKENLNFPESRVLLLLSRKAKMNVAGIAAYTNRRVHSVYALISKMEKRGLVKRTIDKKDGRVYLQITSKARKSFNRIHNDTINTTFSALSYEEKKHLESCIKKLHKSLRMSAGFDFQQNPYLPFIS